MCLSLIPGNIGRMKNGESNRPSSANGNNGSREMQLPHLPNATNNAVGPLSSALQRQSNRRQFHQLKHHHNSVKASGWRGWRALLSVLVLLLPLGPFLGITLARDIEIFD